MNIRLILSHPNLTGEQLTKLKSLGDVHIIDAEKLSAQEVITKIPEVEILVTGSAGISQISRELLQGLKNLKYISVMAVGTDWIDIAAAKEMNIPISTIKGANSESVAEHTWGMILDLAKRISEFDRDVRNTGAYDVGLYQGKEVYGKTLGVIGLGDIGKKVARIAAGFDMKVIGTNESGKEVPGVKRVDLQSLLHESDVISVCTPLTPKTRDLIGDAEFSLMKDGVILVNCSREEVVNKDAIMKALRSGKIWGYGIETEIMKPVAKDDPYLSHPRVVLTPHNAFNTIDAERKSFDTTITNIESFLAGKPQNLAR